MSEGNWKDKIDKAMAFIENNDLARAECFVAMQSAILSIKNEDPSEIFKAGVLFGAAKMLDVEPEINQAVTLEQLRIENQKLRRRIEGIQNESKE